jgi:hypothetical protein
MAKRVSVIQESSTGRNQAFHDNANGRNMTRAEFVARIKAEQYPHFHVRVVHGVETPVSNPDTSKNNNLG